MLDKRTRSLLYHLDKNSRETNKALGKKIRVTQQGVGQKIKKLQGNGIIKHFVTFVNTLSLGYSHYKVFLKLHNSTRGAEARLFRALSTNSHIRWAARTSGKYDASFSVLARTGEEFLLVYGELEAEFGKYIVEKNVLLNVRSPGYTRAYLVDKPVSEERSYQTLFPPYDLDEIETDILKAVAQDARKNVVTIASEIGHTVDVVRYRLRKLVDNYVISGYTIEVDLAKIGYEYYSVFFQLHDFRKETEQRVRVFAENHPHIRFAVRTVGSHDLQLEFEVENYAQLDENLKEFREEFNKHIRDFEILRVTEQFKYNFFPFGSRRSV